MITIDKLITGTQSEKTKKAKENLKQFVTRIDGELQKYFDGELEEPFGVSERERKLSRHIWEHIAEHNLRPAKRLRGSFVYYGYKMLGGRGEKNILRAAMFMELVHTGALMHDDFMDQDAMRRGKPTTHRYYSQVHKQEGYQGDAEHYGAGMAINAGDVALYAGNKILALSGFGSEEKLEALVRLFDGVINTAFGQAFDITLEASGKAEEQDIFDLHLAKTAIYTYETPLHVGAILAGAKEKDLELLSEYAIPGGVAFQLQDDILGLYGNPEKTGKPAHSDMRQGKMTLLVIKALELGNREQKKRLRQLWGKSDLTDSQAEEARTIVRETGSVEYSKKVSVEWAKKAQRAVLKMRKRGWNKGAIDYLDGIAQYMIEREV